jgi:hypothetical protein
MDAKVLFQKLLLLNNVISHYLNNFLFFEKSNFFKTSYCIKLQRHQPPQLRRGNLALVPEKVILQLMSHPGRSNLAALYMDREMLLRRNKKELLKEI